MLAGKIDVQFRVRGSKGADRRTLVHDCATARSINRSEHGQSTSTESRSSPDSPDRSPLAFLAAAGTASFTSIRRGKNGRFEVLRWKITRDDGAVLDLMGLDLTKPLEGLE